MTRVLRLAGRVVRNDEGQDLIEYALLMFLMAIVAIGGIMSVSDVVNNVLWGTIAQNF
jgi:Flp pilus assembly pilin Flp